MFIWQSYAASVLFCELGQSLTVPLSVVIKSHIFFSLLGVSLGNFTTFGRRLCRTRARGKRRGVSASPL